MTIGHNPFALQLTKYDIFLPRNRPLFLFERILEMSSPVMMFDNQEKDQQADHSLDEARKSILKKNSETVSKTMSSNAIMGEYSTLAKESRQKFSEKNKQKAEKQSSTVSKKPQFLCWDTL